MSSALLNAVFPSLPTLTTVGGAVVLLAVGGLAGRWWYRHQHDEEFDLLEEKVADNLRDAVLIVSLPDQEIQFWNQAATRIFGIPARDAVGRTTRLLHISDENFERLQENCTQSLQERELFRTEYPLRRSDGETLPTEHTVTTLPDNASSLALYVIRDISRRKQAEAEAQEHEKQREALMASVSEIVLVIGEDGSITYASPSTQRALGYWPQEIVGASLSDLVVDEDQSTVRRLLDQASESDGGPASEEFRCSHKQGQVRRLEALARRPARGTHLTGTVVSLRDVTERREAEEALRRSEEKYSKIFRISPLAISISRRDNGTILEANEGFYDLFDFDGPEEVENRSLNDLGAWVDTADWKRVQEQVRATGTARRVEAQIQTKSGEERDVLIFAERLSLDGNPCLLTVGHDITTQKRAERELQKLALYDSLTELPNRNLFEDRLNQALKRAERNETGLGVLFLDLDRFKIVNDTLGHHAGDELLAKVADRLRSCFRAEDTVARFGGDEFAALLEDLERGEEAEQAANRLVEALEQPVELSESSVHVTASIGIALRSSTLTKADDLLRFSDVAMYRAKQQEGTSYEVFDPSRDGKATQRLHIENELRGAVERDELNLVYQPIVELESGRMTGVEALVRWDHPDRDRMSPSEFIPVAEEAGLIVSIGEWVLTEACRTLRRWKKASASAENLYMSVNLSVRQLTDADVVDVVRNSLTASGLPADHLQLEITESTAMRRSERLQDLKDLGVRLAIDDFGTGYSSFEYLKHLTVDTIKIDQSFVGNLQEASHDAAIVQSVLLLAEQLGLDSVAEGVMQESQHQYLKYRGCRHGQGFYYLEPAPADTIAGILEDGRRALPQTAVGGEG